MHNPNTGRLSFLFTRTKEWDGQQRQHNEGKNNLTQHILSLSPGSIKVNFKIPTDAPPVLSMN